MTASAFRDIAIECFFTPKRLAIITLPPGAFESTSREFGSVFKTADHSTTCGGKNQLGISAGRAMLDIVKKESLEDAAKERGAQFMAGLSAHGNNLRITPPLVITPGQVERALAALGEVFARVVPASKTA
jgi:acetylornithine/succinyldiaminopimelate/putrescine aminotransferase